MIVPVLTKYITEECKETKNTKWHACKSKSMSFPNLFPKSHCARIGGKWQG